jgi:hypothetical protein
MTFRGLGIWDLGIIGLGFVDLGGCFETNQAWVEEPAQWHQLTGRARKERGPGFGGAQ